MDIYVESEITASAARVWAVVGERFDDLSWSSNVTHSLLEGEIGVGAERVCHFPPNFFSKKGQVRERLLSFDPSKMSLSYQASGLAGPVKTASNHWTVVPLGLDHCRVEMRASVEIGGMAKLFAPLFRVVMRRMGAQTLNELQQHVATATSSVEKASAPLPKRAAVETAC